MHITKSHIIPSEINCQPWQMLHKLMLKSSHLAINTINQYQSILRSQQLSIRDVHPINRTTLLLSCVRRHILSKCLGLELCYWFVHKLELVAKIPKTAKRMSIMCLSALSTGIYLKRYCSLIAYPWCNVSSAKGQKSGLSFTNTQDMYRVNKTMYVE